MDLTPMHKRVIALDGHQAKITACAVIDHDDGRLDAPNLARKSLCASAKVVSDGLSCFQAVTSMGVSQERTVTGGGAASVKLEQFRAVNTFPGNLKTAFAGTYQSFDFAKYAHRNLADVQHRFNRRFDLSTIFGPPACFGRHKATPGTPPSGG